MSTVLAAGVGASAGPFGLLLVLLIGVATVLLIRNMDRRVKRLPREFPPPDRDAEGDAPGRDPAPGPR